MSNMKTTCYSQFFLLTYLVFWVLMLGLTGFIYQPGCSRVWIRYILTGGLRLVADACVF